MALRSAGLLCLRKGEDTKLYTEYCWGNVLESKHLQHQEKDGKTT